MGEVVILRSPGVKGVPRWCKECTKTFSRPHINPRSKEICTEDPVWLVLREGKYGKFWGCPNFPKCKYSESVPKKKAVYSEDTHWDIPIDEGEGQ
jgi:DNA topoisomerase-1